ncbi:MAG: rhodanese-like domain-containing protein [Acidimicrobiia bacterium]|jgi:rhodanese-related sulfurtransferase
MFKDLFKSNAVTVTDAVAMVADGNALLVDVRTRQEWKTGHAPVARHISLASLENQMGRIPKDRTVLAICATGSRSARATAMLRGVGYEARNVKGGMRAWARAGLEVTKK